MFRNQTWVNHYQWYSLSLHFLLMIFSLNSHWTFISLRLFFFFTVWQLWIISLDQWIFSMHPLIFSCIQTALYFTKALSTLCSNNDTPHRLGRKISQHKYNYENGYQKSSIGNQYISKPSKDLALANPNFKLLF